MSATTQVWQGDSPVGKPHYLGLLNFISLAEGDAGIYLRCWASVTNDPELKSTLEFVADRESTHGRVFRQRVERLGFSIRPREDPEQAERLKIYGDPALSDMDKLRWRMRDGGTDYGLEADFAKVERTIVDESVDALTRATLSWYLAEERDTLALLRSAFIEVEKHHNRTNAGSQAA